MKQLILLLMSVFLLFSCSEEHLETPSPTTKSKRTLLFYLAGDNNLSFEIQQQREALKEGWNAQTMGQLLVVSDDRIEGKPILETLIVQNGQNKWDTIKQYANANSACPCVLKAAIKDMQNYATAPQYGFITFSHATGWLPKGAFEHPNTWSPQTRSLITDNNDQMEFSDFTEALPDGLFDFIVFDMCFMANVETTYALRNKTKYILASSAEVLSPGISAIYSTSLDKLYEDTPNLEGFANDFFNYFDALQPPYRSATISVLDTEPMERLSAFVKELPKKQLSQQQVNEIQAFDRKTPHLFFDFAQYYQAENSTTTTTKFHQLLEEIVRYKAHTSKLINIDITKHSGLTTYIPQQNLTNLNTAYQQTEWAKSLK